MKVVVLLPTYKNFSQTQIFLESLSKNVDEFLIKVLILDASPERGVKRLVKVPNNICVEIADKENLWWGQAMNALKERFRDEILASDLVICANPDVIISGGLENFLRSVRRRNAVVHPTTIDHRGRAVTSGQILLSWLPYLTRSITSGAARTEWLVDFLNARFCVWPSEIFVELPYIPSRMPQYCGDYYLSYYQKLAGSKLVVDSQYKVFLDDRATGIKTDRLSGLAELIQSFYSTRSSNNLQARFAFANSFHGKIFSSLVVLSMIVNVLMRYLVGVMREKSFARLFSKKR